MEDRTMSPLGSTEGGVVDKRQIQRESDPTTETVDDEVSADDRRHTPSAVILEPEQPLSEAIPPPHSESTSDHGGGGELVSMRLQHRRRLLLLHRQEGSTRAKLR